MMNNPVIRASRRILGLASIKAVGMAATFAQTFLVTAALSLESAGYVLWSFATATLTFGFGKIGLDLVLLKILSRSSARATVGGAESVIIPPATFLSFIGGGVAASAAAAILWVASDVTETERFEVLMWSLVAVPFLSASMVLAASLRGLGEIKLSAVFLNVLNPALVALAVGAVAVAGAASGVILAMAFLGAAVAGTVIVLAVMSRRVIGDRMALGATVRALSKEGWAQLAAYNVVQSANVWAVLTVAGVVLKGVDSAVLIVCFRIASVVNIFVLAANHRSARVISRAANRGKHRMSSMLARRAGLLAAAQAALAAVAVLLFSRHLLALFGLGSGDAIWPLAVLLAGNIVASMVGPTGFCLAAIGKERLMTIGTGAGVAASVLLVLALGGRFGVLLCAVAIASGSIIQAATWWRGASAVGDGSRSTQGQ